MKKIAVIGAGYSGLSTCWHFREAFPSAQIDLFDKSPIGENTSGASTGLMHGFVGRSAKKSLYADDAIKCALPLLKSAQKNIKQKLYYQEGLVRLAINEEIDSTLQKVALAHDEVEYLSVNQVKELFSGLVNHSGIFIKNAITVNSVEYLKGLFLDLKNKGISFFQKKVNQEDLKDYDIKIFCTGHDIDLLVDKSVKYEKIKGQMLICEWPDDLPELKLSVCGNGHITTFGKMCLLGATYEHDFQDTKVDANVNKVIDRIKTFFPLVEKLKIIDAKAGIRIKRRGSYFPLVMPLGDNSWLFSCLGSRGLLYHSYLAKKLAYAIKDNSALDKNIIV